MASGGRCAGCQETGDARSVQAHILTCAKWAALFRDHREQALTAAEEYQRWFENERDSERDHRRETAIADTDARRGRQASRFQRRDPLEEP
jgi:hypothetical protein